MKYLESGGALSADFKRVPKEGRTKSGTSHKNRDHMLPHTLRTGGAMTLAGGIKKAKLNKARAAKGAPKHKGGTKTVGGVRRAKKYKTDTADFFTDLKNESNPFEGVSFG